jgi:predicted nucleic acid-binding protein
VARVLLDTTVLIDLLRGRSGARTRLFALREAGDDPYVCAVNVEETFRGLRRAEYGAAEALFAGIRVAALGAREGWLAGGWRREFAERGRTLAQADCLVAAAASSNGGRLATGNPKDFPINGLMVEHWPVGA